MLGREQRDHLAALVGDDDFFLDAGAGETILRWAEGFDGEHHAFLDLGRMIHRDHARDDRAFVQRQAEAVRELQAESRQFIREAELAGLREGFGNMRRRGARLDAHHRVVQPFARQFVGVVLRRRGAADGEGAVIAGAIPDEGLQDVEIRHVAGADHAVGEVVRMRVAALAGHGVHCFDVIRAVAIKEVVDHRDNVVLAHARPQLLVHEVIGAIDHAGGVVEQRDLVLRLDLAGFEHDLLAVGDLEAGLLQFEHHRRFDDIDADRHVGDAVLAQNGGEFFGVLLHQAEGGRHGAAQADQAGLAILRVEPWRIKLVMDGGGAEVPQDRFAGAGQQRPARQLVAFPFADLGRGQITDVVDVEHQQRAEFGLLQRLLGAAEPVTVQAAEVDALLEVDAHDAERGQRTAPVMARVDVFGADLAD